ncbi:hypothetical protein [Nannocystis sp.]|uniref:hypothetical protein n=1 Tax=Nannocystis sp. TaxID=1962667 RepID=UPI002423BAA1|nr:hypothetical protein [Nannocystis sp.]MBK7827786.1 hypothetical protein [Nannocystis sp.]MBK9753826.1 hypothetical protein [Nannocystis sp.]
MTKTSSGVGLFLAALCACVTPQGGTTSDAGSSSGGGSEPTTDEPPDSDASGPIQTVTSDTDPDPTGSSTATSDASSSSSGHGDTTTGDACTGIVDALALALSADARCQLLLALDADAGLVGWHAVCGAVPPADVYDAKSALTATACCADGMFLQDVSPFVVYFAPADPAEGGVAIVSNHLGAVVFDATIGIANPGTISVPDTWSPVDMLGVGAGCSDQGVDLTGLQSFHAGDGEIPVGFEAKVGEAIDATALPAALAGAATIDRAVLLGYEDHDKAPSSYLLLLELRAT